MTNAFYQDFTLGVLGGGQLGRMLIQSAIDFNIDVSILDPDENAPCRHIATHFIQGALTDYDTVYAFGKNCDVVTIEIENVNTQALQQLRQEGVKIFPEPEIIALIQDKREQKMFYQQHQIPTADFVLTESRRDLSAWQHMFPAVHKLGRAGYDGRGVQKLQSVAEIDQGFDQPGVLEKLIDFDREIAVIVARNTQGEIRTFPPVEMVFHPEKNLVEYLLSPAQVGNAIAQQADNIAKEVVKKLGMTGLLAVEMFVTKTGEVLVNEVAPRPHNSGHHTIEANVTSQFEQHLRAILGLPLGDTGLKSPAAMVNLLGEEGYTGLARFEGLSDLLNIAGVKLHLYGKKFTKPFRKMGHITVTDQTVARLKEKVKIIQNTVKVKA